MKTGFIAITGASSGIGKATAQLFLEKGYNVLLMARRVEKMEEFASNPNALVKKVDVTEKQQIESALAEAQEKFGDVNLIVNNAGLMQLGSIENQDPKEWVDMNQVNVLGVLNGMQAVLPSMIKRNTGTIVNISSIAGIKTFPNHAAYVGTKFAVSSISENVREEVADKNVRVIVVEPGVVETELLGHTTVQGIIDGYKDWKKTIDGGLDPKVVASTILFVFEQPQCINIREVVLAPTKQQA